MRDLHAAERARRRTRFPKVSLHLPCYNEPPDMVNLTLDAWRASTTRISKSW